MTQKVGELKKRCRLAKQRLKMGYWESLKQERQTVFEIGATMTPERLADYRRDDSLFAVKARAQDEKMYKKVCDILDSDEIATNPIGQLIERELYDKMDSSAKQRYILELSEKFRELKERYNKERTSS